MLGFVLIVGETYFSRTNIMSLLTDNPTLNAVSIFSFSKSSFSYKSFIREVYPINFSGIKYS